MAVFGASFQIGRSALAAYQAALSVTGQNIANLGNPDYVRQTGRLSAEYGGYVVSGVLPGAGVRLTELRRHVDESIESRLRFALSERGRAEVLHRSLSQTEANYNELTDTDLSTLLGEFFGAFGALEASPGEAVQRDLVISAAEGVIRTLQRQRRGLVQQVQGANEQAAALANQAAAIASEIASLNRQIVIGESDGVTIASPLRDRREGKLRELAEIMDITVREQPGGAINVYAGSEPLVEFDRSRGIVVQRTLRDGLEIARVVYGDNGGPVSVREGKLAGLIAARDVYVRDQLNRLDTLAAGLIYEVNRIHSSGRGLVGYSTLTSEHAPRDVNAPLNSVAAGLPFPVQNGTLLVKVRDVASGAITTRQIDIDLDGLNGDDTSLASLAAALNGVPGVTATIAADGRLTISAGAGLEVSFAEDSSGVLAALGVAGFFRGTTAADIGIADAVAADPRRIAASLSGEAADGSNAGRIAALMSSTAGSALLGHRSIQDYHSDLVGDLAVRTHAAQIDLDAADASHTALTAQREAVSGVSLDEEAINLTKYEKAYQGAARYLSVINQLTDEILRLV